MNKVLLHPSDGVRRVIDASSIYYVEAVRGDTVVRRRPRRPLKDLRKLGVVMKSWKNAGLVRVHRNHAVNPEHVLEIRRRPAGRNWELRLAPPVNRVLPVARPYLKALLGAFGER
jgi:DNA-binding LytR/AlgR family response regulator